MGVTVRSLVGDWLADASEGRLDGPFGGNQGSCSARWRGWESTKTFWYTLSDYDLQVKRTQEGYFGMFDGVRRMKPAFYSYYTISKLLSSARPWPGTITGGIYRLALRVKGPPVQLYLIVEGRERAGTRHVVIPKLRNDVER